MRFILKYPYYSLLCLVLFPSCTNRLNYDYHENPKEEVVNGFVVGWANEVTMDKQAVLRTIINNMICVEGGVFMMGINQVYDPNARSNESPAHYVRLSDFFISAYELTSEQITCITGDKFWDNNVRYSYEDWKLFVELLNEYTGLKFDFPTEAQWEFAARGGNQSQNYLYPGSNDWEDVWGEGVEGAESSIANELGLHNMADNHAEWCKDIYAEYNANGVYINPCNIFGDDGSNRVVRGGCSTSNSKEKTWGKESSLNLYNDFYYSQDDYRLCRSTARSYYDYSYKKQEITWRPVINIQNNEE